MSVDESKLESIVRKIEALLNTKGRTEAEAQLCVQKAQELLERYNLDMASIRRDNKSGPEQRKDVRKGGGLYGWQRKLWKEVAELNFCHYITIKGQGRGTKYEHRVIGSHANVIATDVMARYLQDTIEGMAQRWAKDNLYRSVFVREAIAFREGMTARISERLRDRREQAMTDARKQQEEQKQRQARNAADPGTNALTILDVISTEEDLNNDYLFGLPLGSTAKARLEREKRYADYFAQKAEEDRRQAEYDAAHPEEAAERARLQREELEKWAKRNAKRASKSKSTSTYRKPTPEEERAGLNSYYQGVREGDRVNIDQQVEGDVIRRVE